MFSNFGKCTKSVTPTSAVVSSKETSGDISGNKQESLTHNSCRYQHKINAQATKIATMKTELDWEGNHKLKEMFDPDQLVYVLTKVVINWSV